jgi:hypothetical protein
MLRGFATRRISKPETLLHSFVFDLNLDANVEFRAATKLDSGETYTGEWNELN